MALVCARVEGSQLRSNVSTFFVVTAVLSLGALGLSRHFGAQELRVSGLLVPGAVVGFAASGFLRPWVDRGHLHAAALWLSALARVGAVVQGLVS